jgi:hypothetical protein
VGGLAMLRVLMSRRFLSHTSANLTSSGSSAA